MDIIGNLLKRLQRELNLTLYISGRYNLFTYMLIDRIKRENRTSIFMKSRKLTSWSYMPRLKLPQKQGDRVTFSLMFTFQRGNTKACKKVIHVVQKLTRGLFSLKDLHTSVTNIIIYNFKFHKRNAREKGGIFLYLLILGKCLI